MIAALLALALPAAAAPELVVTDIEAVNNGGDIEVEIRVANEGDETSDYFYIDLFGAADGAWTVEEAIIQQSLFVSFLSPGEKITATFSLDNAEWTNAASVYGTVDIDDFRAEGDETDNLGELIILPVEAGEPGQACNNLNRAFPETFEDKADAFNPFFLGNQNPHLYCKSRVL